jgi:hypothetical protein
MTAARRDPTRLEEIRVPVEWPERTLGHFWLLQPDKQNLAATPPYCHAAADADTWPLLQQASTILLSDQGGPVFYVVPELTLDPARLTEILAWAGNLPENHVVVAGLGHLTKEQCEQVEPRAAVRFGPTWDDRKYANVALVAIGGQDPRRYLEGKRWPSKWEQQQACHQPCDGARLYTSDSLRFAVLICSELEATGSGEAAELVDRLRAQRADVVFWLQHNPKPRDEAFAQTVCGLYATLGGQALVVCANKRPNGDRGDFGVSGFITRAGCYQDVKADFPSSPYVATECLCSKRAVTRSVLARYDAAMHRVTTTLPRDTPSESDGRRTFLQYVVPFVVGAGPEQDAERRHLAQLFSTGRAPAKNRALRQGLRAETAQVVEAGLVASEHAIAPTMCEFLCFLDIAFVQTRQPHMHANHESHHPAAACGCWEHRNNFDSLYRLRSDQGAPLAVYVGELVLAVAGLTACGRVAVGVSRQSSGNLTFRHDTTARPTPVILAVAECNEDAFAPAYFGDDHAVGFVSTPLIALEVTRAIGGTDAGDADSGHGLHAGNVRAERAALFGSEFWQKLSAGTLTDWLEEACR